MGIPKIMGPRWGDSQVKPCVFWEMFLTSGLLPIIIHRLWGVAGGGYLCLFLKSGRDHTPKIGLRALVGGIFMDIKWPPNILRNFLPSALWVKKKGIVGTLKWKKFGKRKLVWPNAYVVAMYTQKVERKKIKSSHDVKVPNYHNVVTHHPFFHHLWGGNHVRKSTIKNGTNKCNNLEKKFIPKVLGWLIMASNPLSMTQFGFEPRTTCKVFDTLL